MHEPALLTDRARCVVHDDVFLSGCLIIFIAAWVLLLTNCLSSSSNCDGASIPVLSGQMTHDCSHVVKQSQNKCKDWNIFEDVGFSLPTSCLCEFT